MLAFTSPRSLDEKFSAIEEINNLTRSEISEPWSERIFFRSDDTHESLDVKTLGKRKPKKAEIFIQEEQVKLNSDHLA